MVTSAYVRVKVSLKQLWEETRDRKPKDKLWHRIRCKEIT